MTPERIAELRRLAEEALGRDPWGDAIDQDAHAALARALTEALDALSEATRCRDCGERLSRGRCRYCDNDE